MSEDELFADLEKIFAEVDTSDVLDVTTLTIVEILDMIEDLTDDLLEAKQGLRPTNQQSRDKHSLRNALQVERDRRLR